MKLVPKNGKIIVLREKLEERKTPSGLYLPGSAGKPQDVAIVECYDANYSCNDGMFEGMKVVIGRHSGVDINIDNETKTIIEYGDILAVIEDSSSVEMEKVDAE